VADCSAEAQRELKAEIGTWLNGADLAAQYTRNAVKDAWFSADAKGDFSVVDAAFWANTEQAFYRQLQELITAISNDSPRDDLATRQAWHQTLSQIAKNLFDQDFVGAGMVERQNPRRVALAYNQLAKNLNGPKLLQALSLPIPEKTKAPKKTKGAK
jgi:CRISPR system Cascade subunit CasA